MSTKESTPTKHGLWDNMLELTITSLYVDYRESTPKHDHGQPYTVIRFVSTSAKFGICNVVGLNGTLVEDKMR
jgi:hypothetical protein